MLHSSPKRTHGVIHIDAVHNIWPGAPATSAATLASALGPRGCWGTWCLHARRCTRGPTLTSPTLAWAVRADCLQADELLRLAASQLRLQPGRFKLVLRGATVARGSARVHLADGGARLRLPSGREALAGMAGWPLQAIIMLFIH